MQASLTTRLLAAAAVALGALAASGAAQARTDVSLSIGFPGPVYAQPAPVYVPAPQPVYVQPQPVYVQPQPVYVRPAPVYVAPPVVYAAPVYAAPGGYGWREREYWRHRQWEHRHHRRGWED